VNQNLKQLTGLRGLAALIVFVSHASNQKLIADFFGNGFGQLGVMLFFVLSGFLMAHLYLEKVPNTSNIKAFCIARVGRVFPLFVILVILSYIIKTHIYENFHYQINDISILAKSLLFIKAPNEFWTIPIEVQFYVVFILLWFCAGQQKNYKFILLMWLIILAPAGIYFLYYGKILPLLPTYYSVFMFGVIFSFIYKYTNQSIRAKRIADKFGFIFLILIFINLPALRSEYDLVLSNNLFIRTWADPINWIVVFGLFFCALMGSKSLFILNSALFQYLGKISYAFYLLHYPVLILVKSIDTYSSLKFFIALILVVILSHLSNLFLEAPANRAIKSIGYNKLLKAEK
jgi:peptidoglycan/LPS O-acetylase OafA/YrhL